MSPLPKEYVPRTAGVWILQAEGKRTTCYETEEDAKLAGCARALVICLKENRLEQLRREWREEAWKHS